MRKLTANAIGGKDVSPRQEPDALRFEREITVFPALAQTYTKKHQRPNADAGVRRVCGIYGVQRQRNGINHTVSPCPPTEDLKDFLGSKKTFKSGEEKRAVLTTSAQPIPCLRKAFMTD